MDLEDLHKEFLRPGTGGFAVLRRFHAKYSDVLRQSGFDKVDDLVHDVFIALSKIDFSKVNDPEHYIMRAIKLHSWSVLDKALRMKSISSNRNDYGRESDDAGEEVVDGVSPHHQITDLEGAELLSHIVLFKAQLSPTDARMLNLLIDGTERSELAAQFQLKMNTLDTHIRRIRLRLAEYLRGLGYSNQAIEKFR